MSKRVEISYFNNLRFRLPLLFREDMRNKLSSSSEVEGAIWDEDFWDELMDDCGYGLVYPYKCNRVNKKKKHKKKHLYDDYYADVNQYKNEWKDIWFYDDYHLKDDKIGFNSIKEFSDYCDVMGYFVSDDVLDDLTYNYESHCCLSPSSKKKGLLEVVCAQSYGDMFYDVCDGDELEL